MLSITFGFGASPAKEKIRYLTLSQSKSTYTGPNVLTFNKKPLENHILCELKGHPEVLWFKHFDLHIREVRLRKLE